VGADERFERAGAVRKADQSPFVVIERHVLILSRTLPRVWTQGKAVSLIRPGNEASAIGSLRDGIARAYAAFVASASHTELSRQP